MTDPGKGFVLHEGRYLFVTFLNYW